LITGQRKNYPALVKLESKPNRIKLRVVKIELASGVTEYIITSLMDKTKLEKKPSKNYITYAGGEETYLIFRRMF